jgi:hypothetical protein
VGARSLVWAHGAGDGSLALLAIMLGCAPDLEPELGEFVARGEHVEVWASEGLEVCGGNVEHMDRFVKRFREVVGPRPEAEALHRYYVLDEEDWEQTACDGTSGGCTVARRSVYSRIGIPHLHELVHAEIYGRHDSYLEEGIAELYGSPKLASIPGERTVEEGIDVRGIRLPAEDYARAAHFARFLVDRHGIDGFLGVRDRTSAELDYDGVDRAFQSVLGVSLDAELEDYADHPDWCLNAGYRIPLVECDLPALPWDDGEYEMTVDLACEAPHTLGPFHDEVFALGAMEITEPAIYEIDYHAPGTEGAMAWIVKCDSECADRPRGDRELPWEPPFTIVVAFEGLHVVSQLHPGKYWLLLARPSDAPGMASLRVTKRDE